MGPAAKLQVIDEDPDRCAAIGGSDQAIQEQISDNVRGPEVVLELEAGLGGINERQSRDERVGRLAEWHDV
jgi:hypothetical protein